MLLDAASLYFRAFYGVPTSVTAPDGRPVNAVRGFLDMTARLLTTHGPDRLVACWDDDWRPAFRVAALPSYKAHRVAPEGGEEVPDELGPQVPVLVEVLAAAGIDRVGAPGLRGRRRHRHAGHPRPRPGRRRHRRPRPVPAGRRRPRRSGCSTPPAGSPTSRPVDEAAVTAKYGIPGRAYADFAVLRGDPSDGLPGVAGVGAKTAAALINEFGDLAGIRAAVARTVVPKAPLTAAVLKKMHAAADYLDAAPVVVAVATDIDLPPVEGALPRSPADPDALAALAERHGLESSLRRLGAALGWPADALA